MLSDNIKLMYVGMTRAKHTLYLSYPQSDSDKNAKLSKFVAEIQDKCEQISAPDFDENTFLYGEESKQVNIIKEKIERLK